MIQRFVSYWTALGQRRVGAFLLAVSLNLALVPCTMALEVVEQGHDCCPPELQLDASECCELDDASVDARTGLFEPDDQPEPGSLSSNAFADALNNGQYRHTIGVDPPDLPGISPPLYKLNCVYLR